MAGYNFCRHLTGMAGRTSSFAVVRAGFEFTGAGKLPRPPKSTVVKVKIPQSYISFEAKTLLLTVPPLSHLTSCTPHYI